MKQRIFYILKYTNCQIYTVTGYILVDWGTEGLVEKTSRHNLLRLNHFYSRGLKDLAYEITWTCNETIKLDVVLQN